MVDPWSCRQPWRLKYCTARSCFSALARVVNVPRFRRRPVLGSTLREFRYWPDFSFLIMLISCRAIADALNAVMLGTMRTAVHFSLRLNAVANDAAFAVRAAGSHGVDGTFKTVEGQRAAILGDSERLVVIIAADIAPGHRSSFTH